MLPEYTSVFLHDEIPAFNCGKRRLAILRHTPESTTLFEPSSLRVATVDSETFRQCKPQTLEPGVDFAPAYLAARLHAARKVFFEPADFKKAEILQLLEQFAGESNIP